MNNRHYSHAVCRSTELLSCAKTAVKIAQSRMKQQKSMNGTNTNVCDWIATINPSDLELYNYGKQHQVSPLNEILSDGLVMLAVLESELRRLNDLVRRRGHSNDPTQEISSSVAAIERDVTELTSIVQDMVIRSSIGQKKGQQRQRHIKVIQEWFQAMIQHYATQLKDVLSVRATVLSEQARRRGMFQPCTSTENGATTSDALSNMSGSYNQSNNNSAVTAEAQNALFAPLPQRSKPQNINFPLHRQSPISFEKNTSTQQLNVSATTKNADIISSGGYGGVGYGGNYYNHSNGIGNNSKTTAETGMRLRRKQQYSNAISCGVRAAENNSSEANKTNQQQQFAVYEQQQQNRQTVARLKEARQAEQSLAALGSIFGKMSTLIVQQSETLNKIEDDVEAANVDVNAGNNEITTLYSIKKGNRMLIIKVYSLLIFLIVFMRFYAKK